jgi:hypothetical protein
MVVGGRFGGICEGQGVRRGGNFDLSSDMVGFIVGPFFFVSDSLVVFLSFPSPIALLLLHEGRLLS